MSLSRLFAAALIAGILAVAPTVGRTLASPWVVGDVFAGVGDPWRNPAHHGEYLVYTADGISRNQTVRDLHAKYTTGCYFNPNTQSLWTTSFDRLTVSEYDGATWVRRIDLSPIAGTVAVESIAFDNGGNFFVGLPFGSSPNFVQMTGTGHLVRPYTVPPPPDGYQNEYTQGAVDWIDVAIENGHRIIYYTDESLRDQRWHAAHSNPPYAASVYRYDVDAPGGGAFLGRHGKPLADTTLFALRLLPNNDGMLVAAPGGIRRLNAQGDVVMSYSAPGEIGFYALNIAPDGEHFWTASATTGKVYKFHIASGHLVATIVTGGPVVNGLCVVREYTAIENTCTAADGSTITCPRLEVCAPSVDSNGDGVMDTRIDDDGDGLSDTLDPDCVFVNSREPDCTAAAPSVATIWPANGRMVPITVTGVTDSDPSDSVSVAITAIAQDEPTNTVGDGNTSQDGRYSGGAAYVRAERADTPKVPGDGRIYRISFTATDENGASCSGSVFVAVPHDQGGTAPVRGAVWYNSLTGQIVP
jgi:hypothetical protein